MSLSWASLLHKHFERIYILLSNDSADCLHYSSLKSPVVCWCKGLLAHSSGHNHHGVYSLSCLYSPVNMPYGVWNWIKCFDWGRKNYAIPDFRLCNRKLRFVRNYASSSHLTSGNWSRFCRLIRFVCWSKTLACVDLSWFNNMWNSMSSLAKY